MFSSLLVAAALAPAAPVPKDASTSPKGPPPKLIYLQSLASGTLRVYTYTPRVVKQAVTVTEEVDGKKQTKVVEQEVTVNSLTSRLFADFSPTITTAAGTKKTSDDVVALAKAGVPVLVSSDGNPVDPAWLRAFAPDAVVMVSPDLVGARTTTSVTTAAGGRYPTTQPPTFVQVTSDPNGKPVLQVPPLTPAGGLVVGGGKVTPKPLDEVKFEAFNADGTAVPREDALKRAKAAGALLLAYDARMPDARYLTAFHRDILVIVAPELRAVNPAVGGLRPLPIQVQPLPAAVPAVPAAPAGAVARPAIRIALPVKKPVEKPAEEKPAQPEKK